MSDLFITYAIGMCPQGVTTFVSCAWGVRVSDKHLTVNSGFVTKLLPWDVVLADRGFDIKEDVAGMQASLKIPAFKHRYMHLSPQEVDKTQHPCQFLYTHRAGDRCN